MHLSKILQLIARLLGLRRDALDSNEDRVRDLPPRGGHQGGAGNSGYMSGRQGRPPTQRRDRRDERRRTTDDEDTVLDSQDVSSIDRGNNIYQLIYIYMCVCVDICVRVCTFVIAVITISS